MFLCLRVVPSLESTDPNKGALDPNKGAPGPNKGAPDPRKGAPDPRKGAPDPRKGAPDPSNTFPQLLLGIHFSHVQPMFLVEDAYIGALAFHAKVNHCLEVQE